MEIFTVDGLALLARWVHVMAGVVWIGLLYYFNFVQIPFFAQTEPNIRVAVTRQLIPRALAWFRYSSMVAVAGGVTIILIRFEQAGSTLFNHSYGVSILTGMSLGFLIFLNAQTVLPRQIGILVAAAEAESRGDPPKPEAVSAGRRVMLVSRTNLVLSIPLLFFMVTTSHLTLFGGAASGGELSIYWVLAAGVMLALEAHALRGTTGPTTKPLERIGPSIVAGFVLYGVLYLAVQLIIRD